MKLLKRISIITAILFTVISYQNCAETGFEVKDTISSSLAINSLKTFSPADQKILYEGESYEYKPVVLFTPDETFTELEYTWYKDGKLITEKSESLFLQNLAIADSGVYSVSIHAISKSQDIRYPVASQQFELNVGSLPNIESIPRVLETTTSRYLPPGESMILKGVSASYPKGSIQWYKDEQPIDGATKEYHLVQNAGFAEQGVYHFEISNSQGVTRSRPTLVSVFKQEVEPRVVGNISQIRLGLNQTHVFNFDVVGLPAPSFAITKNGVPLGKNQNNQFQILNATTGDSGTYVVQSQNTAGETLTSFNVFVVDNIRIDAALNCPPVGINKAMNVQVEATGVIDTIEWFRDDVKIDGADQQALSIPATTLTDAGTYKIVMTNISGSVESQCDQIIVEPPVLVTALQDTEVFAGTTIDLVSEFTGFGITYAWFKDDVLINGVNTPNYKIENSSENDSATYKVVATNVADSVESSATVIVNGPPKIETGLANYEAFLGENVTLAIVASGKDITYSWTKDGVNINNNTNTLNLNNFQSTDAGTYVVTVTNPAGSVSSTSIVTALDAPTITTALSDMTLQEGNNLRLTVAASGKNLTYKWFKDNVEIAGATNTRYNKNNIVLTDAGVYRVEVTNASGTVQSQMRLTVTAP